MREHSETKRYLTGTTLCELAALLISHTREAIAHATNTIGASDNTQTKLISFYLAQLITTQLSAENIGSRFYNLLHRGAQTLPAVRRSESLSSRATM